MRIDLFEIIEGLFRGIVFFIYNLIGTTAAIVRHPIRGPIRLNSLYARPDARQIGGLTYLFLAFMLLHWVEYNVKEGLPKFRVIAKWLGQAPANVPSFDFNAIWPILLAALVSTIVIDSVLRLFLRWRFPARAYYRQEVLSATEYSLVWVVIALVLVELTGGIVDRLSRIDIGFDTRIYLLSKVGVLAALYPAAVLLRRAGPDHQSTSFAAGAARIFGLFLLFSLAAAVGLQTARQVYGEREYQQVIDQPTHLRTISCELQPDGYLNIDALAYVEHAPPQAFADSSFSLEFETADNQLFKDIYLRWRTPHPSRYILISEGQPVLIELRTADALKVVPRQSCHLDAFETQQEGDEVDVTGFGIPVVTDNGMM